MYLNNIIFIKVLYIIFGAYRFLIIFIFAVILVVFIFYFQRQIDKVIPY